MTITDEFDGDEITEESTLDAKINPQEYKDGCSVEEFPRVFNHLKKDYNIDATVTRKELHTAEQYEFVISIKGTMDDGRDFELQGYRMSFDNDIWEYEVTTLKGAQLRFAPVKNQTSVVCAVLNGDEYDYKATDPRTMRVYEYAEKARVAIDAHIETYFKEFFDFARDTPIRYEMTDLDDLLEE